MSKRGVASAKILLWLREDLRLEDNPALCHAAALGEILPIYIYPEGLGAASYWWLHRSLENLQADFAASGIKMVLKSGDPAQILTDLCINLGASSVVWSRVYSPAGIDLGTQVKQALAEHEIKTYSFNAQLLTEPQFILNKQGMPYKVFTPYWRFCLTQIEMSTPLPVPAMRGFANDCESDMLDEWGLLPESPDWSSGLAERWQPGEAGARYRWQLFLESAIHRYKEGRDFPAQHSTSYLSPHLAFGEISTAQLWFDLQQSLAHNEVSRDNVDKYLAELGWRDFSRYLLFHFPHILDEPFNAKFSGFAWQNNADLLKAWQHGQTGYPVVDAGMRELWATGYMHNRVRMITASFLTKHCLIDWRLGMLWFWDTLVDADIANNTCSWQWVAGCGADASPYFRIFNPILQGQKFDKDGEYIRRWVPELSRLPNKYIHQPWLADPEVLKVLEITLGEDYPQPVVDHAVARQRALIAYDELKTLS